MSLDIIVIADPHKPVKGVRRKYGAKRRRAYRHGDKCHTTRNGKGMIAQLRKKQP
jgi:hypothetical protein